ncbi:hypothetical protein [Stenomitos frigidus]|uniref:hypothetical protein n=1 Tax=Stenomitos frigidus TaxID=1886765 RepID=UPI001C62EEB4|nr:hypothetical protein [Stenomitos frigidus]
MFFLLLGRKALFDLTQWYRQKGYQADVPSLRAAFPGRLTTFAQFPKKPIGLTPR